MITILEKDPQFLREIEAFARGVAMYAEDEDLWAGFNENWDCYIWWDTDADTYHGCVYPVVGGEIDMSQSMQLNLGNYIGQDRRKRIKEADIVEVWAGDFEFLDLEKCGDKYPVCIVHRMREKSPVPRANLMQYIENVEKYGFSWVIPKEFKGEIYYSKEEL